MIIPLGKVDHAGVISKIFIAQLWIACDTQLFQDQVVEGSHQVIGQEECAWLVVHHLVEAAVRIHFIAMWACNSLDTSL